MTREENQNLESHNDIQISRTALQNILEKAIVFINKEGEVRNLSFRPLRMSDLRVMDIDSLDVLECQLDSFRRMVISAQESSEYADTIDERQLPKMNAQQAQDALAFLELCKLSVHSVMLAKKSRLTQDTLPPSDQQ